MITWHMQIPRKYFPEDKKILVPANCFKCGTEGMAYEDPSQPSKPHFCVNCSLKMSGVS